LLKEAHKEGSVALVHCAWGINRSVTTAAVFMALHGIAPSFDAAVMMIKKERRQAGPLKQYRLWAVQFIEAHDALKREVR
jgi:protein-tyrosine phosphatase